MKAKALFTVLLGLLLAVSSVNGKSSSNSTTVLASAGTSETQAGIVAQVIHSAFTVFEDGLVPPLVRLTENVPNSSDSKNFLYPLIRAVYSLTETQRLSYYKFAQPVLYHASPPLYISIRTLLI